MKTITPTNSNKKTYFVFAYLPAIERKDGIHGLIAISGMFDSEKEAIKFGEDNIDKFNGAIPKVIESGQWKFLYENVKNPSSRFTEKEEIDKILDDKKELLMREKIERDYILKNIKKDIELNTSKKDLEFADKDHINHYISEQMKIKTMTQFIDNSLAEIENIKKRISDIQKHVTDIDELHPNFRIRWEDEIKNI